MTRTSINAYESFAVILDNSIKHISAQLILCNRPTEKEEKCTLFRICSFFQEVAVICRDTFR